MKLSKEVPTSSSYQHLPAKVLQIGEGNFLRGFIDWMIQEMNKQGVFNGSIIAVQPTPHGKVLPKLAAQDYLYTAVLRGRKNGETVDYHEVISSISGGINPYSDWPAMKQAVESADLQIIVSNTTEAGIVYQEEQYDGDASPLSYPGKLAALLHHRFTYYEGAGDKGLYILPCELIEDNGKKLKSIVHKVAEDWGYSEAFFEWLDHSNVFCDTLVDRIVTGFPRGQEAEYKERLGYDDELITVGEPYHLFAIDADERFKEIFPLHKAGLNVKWGGVKEQRDLKVGLLNGPHTLMTPVGYLAGADTVLDVMTTPSLRSFVEQGFLDIQEALPIEEEVKKAFTSGVVDRFLNPYNKHFLLDIGMNSFFKYTSRLLPRLKTHAERGDLPETLVLALAALLVYYKPVRTTEKGLIAERGEEEYETRENPIVNALVLDTWQAIEEGRITLLSAVRSILSREDIWGEDLDAMNGLAERVAAHIETILIEGMAAAVKKVAGSGSVKS